MERRDTWLSCRLQGTKVTTENSVVVSARRAPDKYDRLAASLLHPEAHVYIHSHTRDSENSDSLDFAHRADSVESRAINKRATISRSVIYSPEATPTNPRKTSHFISHQPSGRVLFISFHFALCLLHAIVHASMRQFFIPLEYASLQ